MHNSLNQDRDVVHFDETLGAHDLSVFKKSLARGLRDEWLARELIEVAVV